MVLGWFVASWLYKHHRWPVYDKELGYQLEVGAVVRETDTEQDHSQDESAHLISLMTIFTYIISMFQGYK
jgi:hypothetical protein